MEYYINVYFSKKKNSTIMADGFYSKEEAIEDMDFMEKDLMLAARHQYIHTLKVTDDNAKPIDLRGEQ